MAMGTSTSLLLFIVFFIYISQFPQNVCAVQKCPVSFKISSQMVKMIHCKPLEQLNATLSWTYSAENGSVNVAFRAKADGPSGSGWVSWGINPTGTGMVGTQALLALRQPNGTMAAATYNVTSKTSPPAMVLSNLSFPVADLVSEFHDGAITIFATLTLPSNKTLVNHVWQVGSKVEGMEPGIHAFDAANLKSFGSIDLAKDESGSPTLNAPETSPSPHPPMAAGENGGNTSAPRTGTDKSNGNGNGISLSRIYATLLTAFGIFLSML